MTNVRTTVASVFSLRGRFQTAVIYNAIGALFNQGSSFVVNIIVANLLGRRVFGEYAIVQSTVLTLGVMAEMAVASTATKYVAEFRLTDRERAGRILGLFFALSALLSGIAALALLFLAPWLADSVLKASGVSLALSIGAAVLLFAVLAGFLLGALAGLESYHELAKALILSGIVYLVLCSAFAWSDGLNGAMVGQAFSSLFQFVVLARALRKECIRQGIKLRFGKSWEEWPIIVRFTLPGALSGFASMPALWLASTFLIRQPNGYSQMAIYSASFSLMTAILFLPNVVTNVGMSLINFHKGVGKESDYRRTFWSNFAVSGTIVTFGACLLAVFGPEFLQLFGKDFKDGYPVLLILLVATMAQGFGLATHQIIQSHAKMWLSFLTVALPRDTLIVAVAYLLIPSHGARGFASAYVIAWTFACMVIGVIVCRIGLKPPPLHANAAARCSAHLSIEQICA